MATHTTCDYCGSDVALQGDTWIDATLEGVPRLRDQRRHHVCERCWSVATLAMNQHVSRQREGLADFIAQRREQLPVDRPRRDTVSGDASGDYVVKCRECGKSTDLNTVDFSHSPSVSGGSVLSSHPEGVRDYLNVQLPCCGNRVEDLIVTTDATGAVCQMEWR